MTRNLCRGAFLLMIGGADVLRPNQLPDAFPLKAAFEGNTTCSPRFQGSQR